MRMLLAAAGLVIATASHAQQDETLAKIPGAVVAFRYQCPGPADCSVICWSNVGKVEYQDVAAAQLVEYFARAQQSMPEYLLIVTPKGSDVAQNSHIQGTAACSFTQMRFEGAEGPKTAAPARAPRPRAPAARAPAPAGSDGGAPPSPPGLPAPGAPRAP
jgi:hypothetical protein